VTNLLDGNPMAQILHFAVHGSYNPQDTDEEGIHLVTDEIVGPPYI